MNYKVLLLILDGWGNGDLNISNPIHMAQTPTLDYIRQNYPFCLLQSSGLAIGLPQGEPGSSEIGHLSIGSGKVYYQNYPRISLEIESGKFFENEVLRKITEHTLMYKSKVHLIGLLTQGVQHSALDHLIALLQYFKNKQVYLHLFFDGQDSPPQSGLSLLERLEIEIQKMYLTGNPAVKIATLCGRDYGMDTENNYQIKTQMAYNLIMKGIDVSNIKQGTANYKQYIQELYEKNDFSDNSLAPLLIDSEGIIASNDAILFFNFTADGMMQLVKAFTAEEFDIFPTIKKENLLIASMVQYSDDFKILSCYQPYNITSGLSKIIAENNLKQFKITEISKERLLTYFFNGMQKHPFKNEYWKILKSSPELVNTNPLLQSNQITQSILKAIDEKFDFIAANYPAPDIVGHTGNFNLGVKIAEEIDKILDKIIKKIIKNNEYVLIIASDHGNLENIVNLRTGEEDTAHNNNPVPFYLIGKDFFGKKHYKRIIKEESNSIGILVDIPATILELMGLELSSEFEGKNLLEKIN